MSDSAGAALYGQIRPPQSPLAGVGQTLGTISALGQAQNAIVGAQSNAMQFRARQAMGPILQAAIGPDGQLDYNKALVGMAANPNTAWMAPDFLNQAVIRQKTQADTALTQLELAGKQFGAYNSALGSLVANGPSGATRAAVISKLAELVGNHMVPKEQALQYAANLPPDGQPLYNYLRQHQLQALTAKDQIDTVYGQLKETDVGNKKIISRASPFTGTNVPLAGGTMTVGNTPAEANKLSPVLNQAGEEVPTPRVQVAPMVGPVGNQSNFQGDNTVGTGGGTGPQQLGGSAPQAVGAPPAAAAPGGIGFAPGTGNPVGSITKFSPQRQAFLEGKGPMADYAKDLQVKVTSGQEILPALQEMGKIAEIVAPGPGMPTRTHIAQAAAALGALGLFPESTVNAILGSTKGDALAAVQTFNKFAPQAALNALKLTLGDAAPKVVELEQYFKNFPNLATQPKAVQALLHYTTGMIGIKQQEQRLFAEYQKEPNFDPNQWNAMWNNILMKSKVYRDISKEGIDILAGKYDAK